MFLHVFRVHVSLVVMKNFHVHVSLAVMKSSSELPMILPCLSWWNT